jgi:hypothetical protein
LPVVTALAEAGLDALSYVVDDVSLMVTCALPAVVTVNPDADVLLTVPVVPPGAGPERALEPPPDPKWPAKPLLAAEAPLLALDEPLLEFALTIP